MVSVRRDHYVFYSVEKTMFGVTRWRHLEDKWLRAAFVWACRSERRPSAKLVAFAWK